jgi:hypothetical protein
MVVALIALVLSLAGSAVAAGVLITSSSQIGNGVITGVKIHSRTITDGNIRRGSLAEDVLKNRSIDTGKLTPDAVKALSSSGTTATEYFRKTGPDNVAGGNTQRVITATNLPSGVYAIFAKTIITDLNPPSSLLAPGQTSDAHCRLSANGDIDDGRVLIGSAFGSGPGDVSLQITSTDPGTVTLDCDSAAMWRASDSTIVALRLGNAGRVPVTG